MEVVLNLRRLKYGEKIFLGLTADVRMCNFFSRNGRRKIPVSRLFRIKRGIVFLSGIDRLLLILVVPELFFQITFTLTAGSGCFPVNAEGCSDVVVMDFEVKKRP